jgi:DNA-binding NarL/FixJ family response regulator
VKIGQYPVLTRWKKIIELIAQGFGRQAIAKELGVTPYAADHQITHILNHFYATNRAHLVAIAVSLGIIDPRSFVPKVEEKQCP